MQQVARGVINRASESVNESDWDESIILDRDHLAAFTGGDPDFEKKILDIFLDNAPQYLASLRDTGASDWKATAHKLKGAARSIGAWNLAREGERAEHMGTPMEDDPKRQTILQELEKRLALLVSHIEAKKI